MSGVGVDFDRISFKYLACFHIWLVSSGVDPLSLTIITVVTMVIWWREEKSNSCVRTRFYDDILNCVPNLKRKILFFLCSINVIDKCDKCGGVGEIHSVERFWPKAVCFVSQYPICVVKTSFSRSRINDEELVEESCSSYQGMGDSFNAMNKCVSLTTFWVCVASLVTCAATVCN